MANSILGFFNLLKLRGSLDIEHDGEQGVFIPYNKNGSGVTRVKEDGKLRANLRVAIVAYRDKFGHDFMAIRAKTAWEFKHNKATEIFGNLKLTKSSIIELDPNEEYLPDIINYVSKKSESEINEEKEFEL